MKIRFVPLVLGFCLLTESGIYAQVETEIEPVKSKVLTSKILDKAFIRLIKTDDEVKTLAEHLNNKGFVAQRGINNFYGVKEKYKDVASNNRVVYKYFFQDYKSLNSKDLIALGQISIRLNCIVAVETYTFYLIAPDGDFENMEEYYIDKRLNIHKADSWWSCTKRRVSKKCPTACMSAFVECIPSGVTSVAGYLACVASRCVGCLVKAGSCCICDCHWICRWAIGCCER